MTSRALRYRDGRFSGCRVLNPRDARYTSNGVNKRALIQTGLWVAWLSSSSLRYGFLGFPFGAIHVTISRGELRKCLKRILENIVYSRSSDLMANRKHVDVLQQRVKGWNAWREHHPDIDPDLREANLIRADLARVNLSRASLRGANLRDANLGAANLYRADLREANLSGTDLRKARLSDANLSNAIVSNTNFGDVDLSGVEGLEEIKHEGPSTIGIDTIYRSSGKISSAFLRGAGVPENFITYMKSLVGQVLDYYSCFISYSTADQTFADRLHADLQARNVRCWFAPHDIQGGRKLHEQIDEAIRYHDKLLLILSDHSMNSNWVKTEIANARAHEEHQRRQMLFPITLVPFESVRAWKCFDADSGVDSARVIREYFVPDFSDWADPDSYQRAFDRLLRDLEANRSEAQCR